MSKSVRRFFSLLLVLQLVIPYSVFAAPVGNFTSVIGKVTQMRAKEVVTPIVKSPVQLKDLIITEQASSAAMVFSDESSIILSGNAKLEIKEFLFKDKSRTSIFSLAMGKLTATVSKYIGGDNIFEVQSPTAIVGVRGTGFEFDETVNAENKNMATVSCTEGSLNLSALSPTGAVVSTAVLYAGQMAVIIGGVITISAIAAVGDVAAKGLSTGAKIAIGGGIAAVVAGTAAAIGGGGGGDSHSSTPTTPTSPESATLSFRLYEASSDDFDMIITKPNGTTIYFYNTSEYSQDSVTDSGPDIAYWQSPLSGIYTIQIQCYYNMGSSRNRVGHFISP